MTSHRLLFAALATAVLGLVACGSDSTGSGDADTDTVVQSTNQACSADAPCPDGLTCAGNFGCVAFDCPESGLANGCPDGFFCVDPALDGDDERYDLSSGRRFCARICTAAQEEKDTCGDEREGLDCDPLAQGSDVNICIFDN